MSSAGSSAQRDLYIDRLRAAMIALVILHHTAITYGAYGDWYWHEVEVSASPSSLVLSIFCFTNQSFFMGILFLLAGYFTPASLERKGYGRFWGDRLLRLGLPVLVFSFTLAPLTYAMVSFGRGEGFWREFAVLWHQRRLLAGPLWFLLTLLVFSLGYCALRALLGPPLKASPRDVKRFPTFGWWLLGALSVGAAALAIRKALPSNAGPFRDFASYVFLFAVGVVAKPNNWLPQLRWNNAKHWVFLACIAWPIFPLALVFAGSGVYLNGFPHWLMILRAFWEPFLAWGVIAGLLLYFRARINRPSRLWEWISRRAYAVYIIHPPVLVGLTLLLHPWTAPTLVKFFVAGPLACAATWVFADPLVRTPGGRRVV